jgi:energy-coupling factor transporter transmembrane protein EcfT
MSGKSSTHSKNKSSNSNMRNNIIYLLPLIIIGVILPFIMYSYQYDTGLGNYSWFSQDGERVDIFLFYKQVLLLVTCFVMLLVLLYNAFIKKLKLKFAPIFIPIIIYAVLSLFSTILSDNSTLGFKGVYEQFESIFVLFSYCFIVYYAFIFVKSEEDITFILRYLLIGVIIMGCLGIFQAIGLDPIATDTGKRLYLAKVYWDHLDKFTMSFEKHRVYLTLYNPNYVGSYVSLFLPVMLGLLITEKNIKRKLLYIFALLGLIVSLIFSKSDTGIISVIFALILIAIFFRKYIFRRPKVIIPVISCGFVLILIFSIFNIDTIKTKANAVFNYEKKIYNLTNIRTEDDLTITYRGNDMKITLSQDSGNIMMLMTDGDINPISYSVNDDGSYVIDDERFSGIQVSPIMYQNVLCVKVNIEGKDWVFSNKVNDNTFYYLNFSGKFVKIIPSESKLFTGYESLASGRGYLWSRSIPLLKDSLFIGSGADTFVTVFPQQDYVNSYNAGFDGELVTRPHSMFLQIGIQSGVIALIAFLALYIIYLFSSIKLYIKSRFNNIMYQAGISIFIGITAYMISGISNDSTITVAPVSWVLLGIGIAINHQLKLNKQEIN